MCYVYFWLEFAYNYCFFQDAPLHLLGRNHPFVREQQVTKNSLGSSTTSTSSTEADFLKAIEFPFYYEDYGEVAYNYDDQAYVDHDGGIPNVLPIINQRPAESEQQQQKSPFLPTPLPKTTSETLVTADPLPLTTMKVETTTTSTTTTTTTTTTSAPTTILSNHTGANILNLSRNSHFENLIFYKNSHFSNSHI